MLLLPHHQARCAAGRGVCDEPTTCGTVRNTIYEPGDTAPVLVVGCNLLEVLNGSLVNDAHRVVEEVGADQCGDGKDLGIIVCRVMVVMMLATKW